MPYIVSSISIVPKKEYKINTRQNIAIEPKITIPFFLKAPMIIQINDNTDKTATANVQTRFAVNIGFVRLSPRFWKF